MGAGPETGVAGAMPVLPPTQQLPSPPIRLTLPSRSRPTTARRPQPVAHSSFASSIRSATEAEPETMASERYVAGVATSSTPTPRSLIRSGSNDPNPVAPPTRGSTVPPSPDRWTGAASRPGQATTDSQARSNLRDRVPVRPDHVPMLPTAVVSRGRGSATSRRGRFAIDPGAKARRRRDDLARRRHDAAHGHSPGGTPCRPLKRCHRKMTRQSAWTRPGGSTSLPDDVATGGRVSCSTEPHSSEASSPLHGASLGTSPRGRDSLGVAGGAMAAAAPVVAHQHHAARPQWPGTILTLQTRGPRPRRRCCHQRRASERIGAPREGSAHLATKTSRRISRTSRAPMLPPTHSLAQWSDPADTRTPDPLSPRPPRREVVASADLKRRQRRRLPADVTLRGPSERKALVNDRRPETSSSQRCHWMLVVRRKETAPPPEGNSDRRVHCKVRQVPVVAIGGLRPRPFGPARHSVECRRGACCAVLHILDVALESSGTTRIHPLVGSSD